mmetsp:Transcript_55443/g.160677  ORF Transcript_55443/g.160677 Transcript_55443/m.160677 type:complete len:128 (-) Transcript_55443:411-794(-)
MSVVWRQWTYPKGEALSVGAMDDRQPKLRRNQEGFKSFAKLTTFRWRAELTLGQHASLSEPFSRGEWWCWVAGKPKETTRRKIQRQMRSVFWLKQRSLFPAQTKRSSVREIQRRQNLKLVMLRIQSV